MPEINITIAGLEENGFRQQSLRKEQDWAQSPLAKELWRSSLSWARRLKVTSLPCRDASTTQHCLFLAWPHNSQLQGTAPQQLCLNRLHCPVQNWCFPPPQGAAGHRRGTTRLFMCTPISPDHQIQVWSFPSEKKPAVKPLFPSMAFWDSF